MLDSSLGNPFAALTVVVAPAILTNASSVLCMGTANRIARVVDRTRHVAGELAGLEDQNSRAFQIRVSQLERLTARSKQLFWALRFMYASLGLFAASLIILMKRGDPLGWAIRVTSAVLGGVFYPMNVLPGWLRALAQALPLTHALELMRRSLLNGEGWAELQGEMLTLIGLTALLLPLGLLACALAVRVARTDGSLSHY